MGLFDSAVDKRISKLILEYAGKKVIPEFHTPCHSSISLDWDGWCAIDQKSIWLVNKWGARGVLFEKLTPTANWGQYPHGTRGFPKYRFEFLFASNVGGFTIYPKTAIGGAEMNQRFETIFRINDAR